MKPTTDFPVDLTDEQVAFFRDNGFLSIDRITTDQEVERLRGIYDRLFTERLGEEKGEYFDLAGPRAHDGREVLRRCSARSASSRNYARPSITGTPTAWRRSSSGWTRP